LIGQRFTDPAGARKLQAMVNLEDLLDGLTLAVDAFAICAVPDGEELHLPATDKLTLHFALQGTGEFRAPGGSWRALGRHGLIVVPPKHSLAFKGRGRVGRQAIDCCRTAPAGLEWRGDAAADASIILVCARLSALYQGTLGLFDFLNEPLLQDFENTRAFERLIGTLVHELADAKPGAKSMVDALLRECLILLLREQCDGVACAQPWLSALAEPRLGRALMAMVERPQAGYTVERLAALAGMSRATFTERFARRFGLTPIEFLRRRRLERAATLLATTDLPIKRVAAEVGYTSRSYFSRAFHHFYGHWPTDHRGAVHRDVPTRPEHPPGV
jgi:AraC-like DNA-binding protein